MSGVPQRRLPGDEVVAPRRSDLQWFDDRGQRIFARGPRFGATGRCTLAALAQPVLLIRYGAYEGVS